MAFHKPNPGTAGPMLLPVYFSEGRGQPRPERSSQSHFLALLRPDMCLAIPVPSPALSPFGNYGANHCPEALSACSYRWSMLSATWRFRGSILRWLAREGFVHSNRIPSWCLGRMLVCRGLGFPCCPNQTSFSRKSFIGPAHPVMFFSQMNLCRFKTREGYVRVGCSWIDSR